MNDGTFMYLFMYYTIRQGVAYGNSRFSYLFSARDVSARVRNSGSLF